MYRKLKNIFICAALAMASVAGAMAQTVGGTDIPGLRHVKNHILMIQADSAFNVVDVDIEWPEMIGTDSVMPLKKTIIYSLMKEPGTDLDHALMVFNNSCGEPVTGKLSFLPDDNRFCYVTIKAKVRSYEPGRWICYELVAKNEPQRLSYIKARDFYVIITYDLANHVVLLPEAVLNGSAIANGGVEQEFYDKMFEPLSDEQYQTMQGTNVNGVWLDRRGVGMHINCLTADGRKDYEVFMPYDLALPVLTREAKKLTRGVRTN